MGVVAEVGWRRRDAHEAFGVQDVLAARRTAECFGGWEYLVRWQGQHEDSWEPATCIGRGEGMQSACEGAQRTAYVPCSYRDSLEWRARQGRGQDRAQARRLLERCKRTPSRGRGSGTTSLSTSASPACGWTTACT